MIYTVTFQDMDGVQVYAYTAIKSVCTTVQYLLESYYDIEEDVYNHRRWIEDTRSLYKQMKFHLNYDGGAQCYFALDDDSSITIESHTGGL